MEVQRNRIVAWFTKRDVTLSFVKPRRIGDDHRSQGREDCAWFSSNLGSSDKSKTVIDFFATESAYKARQIQGVAILRLVPIGVASPAEVGLTAVVVPPLLTVWVRAAEVLPASLVSPP